MLKSAMDGKIGRVTIKVREKLGNWELWQSGALASVWHLERVSSFGKGEDVLPWC
ncbi:unnamed protein product [Prunus brigantina]